MAIMTAAIWNDLYPVGTPVRYWPLMGEPEHQDTKTRSEAWELGDGSGVVLVEGLTGGVSLDHCAVIVCRSLVEILVDDAPRDLVLNALEICELSGHHHGNVALAGFICGECARLYLIREAKQVGADAAVRQLLAGYQLEGAACPECAQKPVTMMTLWHDGECRIGFPGLSPDHPFFNERRLEEMDEEAKAFAEVYGKEGDDDE